MSSLLFDDASTLHSFSGRIGICRKGEEEILKRTEKRQDKLSAWAALDVLFIDKGEQISCRVFETVEYMARNIRKNALPFGGLQVKFSGDFYQLGTVKNEFDPALYTFQSYLWDSILPHVIVLVEVVRQGEKDFIQFLSRLAEGSCTQADVAYVKDNSSTTIDPIDFGLDFVPKIFGTNRQIYFETIKHSEELPGDMLNFQSVDEGSSKVLGKCIADKQLCLKKERIWTAIL